MKENSDTMVNPIYRWSNTDIWEYIKREHIGVNPLYTKGYDRVGCIGCPLAPYHQRVKEFADYPEYKQLYIKAFDRMLAARGEKGKKCEWKTGHEVFDWWMEDYKHNVKGQINLWENTGEETIKNA